MTTTPSLPAPTSRHAARVAPQRADGPHPVAAGPGPAAPADPSVGRTGARFHGGAAPAAEQRAGAPTRAAADLPVVLRGYDRGRVDALLRARAAREEELRTALELAERRRAEAVAHAEATQAENDSLRAAQASGPQGPGDAGFGSRAERLLRLAETEAADIRSGAARDAAALVERARVEAENHRHTAEQALIARTVELEDAVTRRAAELQEREDRIAAQAATLRTEAERMVDGARRDAERLRAEAEAASEAARARLAEDLGRQREAAATDIERLGRLREEVQAGLRRLADVVAAQLADRGTAGTC